MIRLRETKPRKGGRIQDGRFGEKGIGGLRKQKMKKIQPSKRTGQIQYDKRL